MSRKKESGSVRALFSQTLPLHPGLEVGCVSLRNQVRWRFASLSLYFAAKALSQRFRLGSLEGIDAPVRR